MAIMADAIRVNDSASCMDGGAGGVYLTAVYTSAATWGCGEIDAAIPISRQSELCGLYLKEHRDLKKVKTYSDRNRVRNIGKEWSKLLDDVECRRVNTVLTCSLCYVAESLSSAIADVGRFFYPAGVRFIAVEDGFDSMCDDIEEYLNRRVSIQYGSVKHRTAERRFKEGKVYKAAVPYGYVYVKGHDPEIVVDEETAPYVQKLFDFAVGGMKLVDMARYMNKVGAPTPRQRREQLYGEKAAGSAYWKPAVIKNILKNPCYTGDYVTGRTREVRIGRNDKTGESGVRQSYQVVAPEDWKVIEDYHEPLISRDVLKRSLDILESRSFAQACNDRNYENPYRNMFVCGHCGQVMTCNRAGVKNGKDYARVFCDSARLRRSVESDNFENAPDSASGGKAEICAAYDLRLDDVVERMKSLLYDEVARAKRIMEYILHVSENGGYQKICEQLDRDIAACRDKLESAAYADVDAESAYGQIQRAVERKRHFKTLFSSENPWLRLFSGIETDALPEFDRKAVKTLFKKIELFRDGSVIIHFSEEEWRKQLEEHWRDFNRMGDIPLWEELI